jgi:hypothetical protein
VKFQNQFEPHFSDRERPRIRRTQAPINEKPPIAAKTTVNIAPWVRPRRHVPSGRNRAVAVKTAAFRFRRSEQVKWEINKPKSEHLTKSSYT